VTEYYTGAAVPKDKNNKILLSIRDLIN
jgi:hypothetical protein